MPSRFGPRLATRLASVLHPKCDLEALACSHPINSTLQLILPFSSSLDQNGGAQPFMQACQGVLMEAAPYMVATVRLGDLVAELVAYFQESSSSHLQFQAVALGPALDKHSGIAFTPDCTLHMAVSKDMYQQLGLPGKTSPSRAGERYNITVKLNAKGFKAGCTFHDKVVDSLNTRMGMCTLAMAWSDLHNPSGGATVAPVARSNDGMVQGGSLEHSSCGTPAPSHGLRSVLQAQSRCCVRPLLHKQWDISPVFVPELCRQQFLGCAPRIGHADDQGMKIEKQQGEAGASVFSGRGTKRRNRGGELGRGSKDVEATESMEVDVQGPTGPAGAQGAQQEGDSGTSGEEDGVSRLQLQQPGERGMECGKGRQGRERHMAGSSCDGGLRASVVRGVHQWLGALSCNLPGQACDRLLPEEIALLPGSNHGVRVRQWSGLISSNLVHCQVQEALNAVASGQVPWVAVAVWGWQDSPVAWLGMEHSSSWNLGLGGSESCYVVLVLQGQDVLVLRALSAGDAPE